jgi:hypothetical protein
MVTMLINLISQKLVQYLLNIPAHNSVSSLSPDTTDKSMSAEKIFYNGVLLSLATDVADLEMVPRGRL